MRVHRRTLASIAVALLGIVVTAALTWSVSRLAAQHIGLSSAPPSAIRGLAPPRPSREESRPGRQAPSRSSADGGPATFVTSATPTPTPTVRTPTPTPRSAAPAPAGTASPSPPAAATSSGSRRRGGDDGGDSARGAAGAGGRGRDD